MGDLSNASKHVQTRQNSGKADASLNISVVFTNIKATLAAFRMAGALATNLNGDITLVVPHVVPYSLPLERPAVLLDWNERRFHVLATNSAIQTKVNVYLCRDRDELLMSVLAPHPLVVIGGSKRWWRRSPEDKLASRLRTLGCEVVIVQAN